jgi:hypothetical protein
MGLQGGFRPESDTKHEEGVPSPDPQGVVRKYLTAFPMTVSSATIDATSKDALSFSLQLQVESILDRISVKLSPTLP